ncbi:MAG: sugar phosphate nucleotidyltransferase, partial [Dehalococcoidia bacterium]
MQIVILAGGLGTRLDPVTNHVPKSLVLIEGRPFLEYQLELLKSSGITDVVLCIGHLGQQVRDFFGDGRAWDVHIEYSDEGELLLGTAGAVRKAEPLLEDRFFVLYGDSYLPLSYRDVLDHFEKTSKLAMMVVYKNDNRYDTSNVILEGDLVQVYDKKARQAGMVY